MTSLVPIDAGSLSDKLKSRELTLIYIHGADEFAREGGLDGYRKAGVATRADREAA